MFLLLRVLLDAVLNDHGGRSTETHAVYADTTDSYACTHYPDGLLAVYLLLQSCCSLGLSRCRTAILGEVLDSIENPFEVDSV